jgi:hypothetical protein
MTTGSAGSRAAGGGTAATGPRTNGDITIDDEEKAIDRKLQSICRGCSDRRRTTWIEQRITSRSLEREPCTLPL